MNKVILMMLLVVMSSSAMAEWVQVNENEQYITYANPTTIRKSGNKVKMWELFDYDIVHSHASSSTQYASVKQQSEYSCRKEQSRILYQVLLSENMGKGKRIITIVDPSKWKPIEPDTIGVVVLKYACGK